MGWQAYALAGAFFGGLTAILAKIGIEGVDSNLATAIRTVVVLIFAWSIVLAQGTYRTVPQIAPRSHLFLVFSGIATGLSWLFYFKALSMAEASRVAPLDKLSLAFTVLLAVMFLRETPNWKVLLGVGLILVGTFCVGWGQRKSSTPKANTHGGTQ